MERWFKQQWLNMACVFLSALYIWLQLEQWKRHGDDLMPEALTISVTVVLWCFLLIAAGRYWKRGLSLKVPATLQTERAPIPADGAPLFANPPVPHLYVRYQVSALRPKLIFTTKSSDPINIKKIGPLISEELYRCEHDLGLLQNVYQPLDANHPLECPMQASLAGLLEHGGPSTLDSVCVECSYKNGIYPLIFYLHKNQDGSVVWMSKEREQSALDLDRLREERQLLEGAVPMLTEAGSLKALLVEAEGIAGTLSEILGTNYNKGIPNRKETDLSKPLSHNAVCFTDAESECVPWQKPSLLRLLERYNRLVSSCAQYGLPALASAPNDLSAEAIASALSAQQEAIRERIKATVAKYDVGYSEQGG